MNLKIYYLYVGRIVGPSGNVGVILFLVMTQGICSGWLQAQILQGHTSLSIGKKTVSNTVLLLLERPKHPLASTDMVWMDISE